MKKILNLDLSVSQFCKHYVLIPNILQRIVLLFKGKVVFKNKLTGIVKYHDGKLYKVRNMK
mgnify:CR=1 FL=1